VEIAILNLVKTWSNVYLKGSEEEARSLFVKGKYEDKFSNQVNLANLPQNINWNNYIVDTKIGKYQVVNATQYEIFFRMDINMELEGYITNCDYMKCLICAELENGVLKISSVRALACYPWELAEFAVQETSLGMVYSAPGVSTNICILEEIFNSAISNLKIMFDEAFLGDLSIVIFPSSQSLCDFLEIKCQWGKMYGKAKDDHIFIVYSSRESCLRTIQHEISHIALERTVEYYKNNYPILPCINEALAEMASLSFNYNNIKKMYKPVLEVDSLSLSCLEELFIQTAKERNTRILAAVSLLNFIQSIRGNKGVLDFIIKSVSFGCLTQSVKDEIGLDLTTFEQQWRIFVKG
jgi:hypothetical protein